MSGGDLSPPRRLGRLRRGAYCTRSPRPLGTFHRLDPPLIHRDLKPQNVLMAGRTPRITDFGIGGAAVEAHFEPNEWGSSVHARMPTMLRTAGSSQYAPQEQVLGSPPSPRDDVYALGVIAYQMVVADTKAGPPSDVGRKLRELRIPSDLGWLISNSVALDPGPRRPGRDRVGGARLSAASEEEDGRPRRFPPGLQHTGDSSSDSPDPDRSELLQRFGVRQARGVARRSPSRPALAAGRCPAGQAKAEWVLTTTTWRTCCLVAGEVYRFSIHSAATEEDVAALGTLSGLTSLRYLNLSYCVGRYRRRTGAPGSRSLAKRQLLLRGCPKITDAGLRHLHALTDLLTLELTDNKQLSTPALAALRKALPKCKVLR